MRLSVLELLKYANQLTMVEDIVSIWHEFLVERCHVVSDIELYEQFNDWSVYKFVIVIMHTELIVYVNGNNINIWRGRVDDGMVVCVDHDDPDSFTKVEKSLSCYGHS